MRKHLRLGVAVVQTLFFAIVFILPKLQPSGYVHDYYMHALQNLVIGLNFPVVAFWVALASPLRVLGPGEHLQSLPWTLMVGALTLVGLLIIASVGGFWYMFAIEVELRLKRSTLLQPSHWLGRLLKAVALLSLGIAAALYSYVSSRPYWYTSPYTAIWNGFFPLIWGILLLGVLIHDLRARFLPTRQLQGKGLPWVK